MIVIAFFGIFDSGGFQINHSSLAIRTHREKDTSGVNIRYTLTCGGGISLLPGCGEPFVSSLVPCVSIFRVRRHICLSEVSTIKMDNMDMVCP